MDKGARAHRLFARYVAFADRNTGLLLFALLALAAGALTVSLRLELHTDMAELLPDEHPAVLALHRVAGRQKSASNLVLLVHSPSAAANRAFAQALRPALDAMVPDVFSEIDAKPDTEIPDFAARWKWLYAERTDLERVEDLLDRIVSRRENPLAVDLEGDPADDLQELRRKLEAKLPTRPPTDWFEGPIDGKHYLGIMMWRRLGGLGTSSDRQMLNTVRSLVERTEPHRFHPQMGVELTGGIAQAIDEQDGIREDLTLATAVCIVLVTLAIYLYFRRLALLLVIGAPAVLGLLLSLTIASLCVHYLNINTAFLISIILGNGINSPIVLLARYNEERRRGKPVTESLTTAMTETFVGTLTAMTAASIAYGCLLMTSFRGFNQFGLLGGAGMLLVWLMTFVLVPPLLLFGERRWPSLLAPRDNLWRRPFVRLGALSQQKPLLPALATLVCLGAALGPLVHYVRDPLEWDFNNLRTDETPSQRLWPKMEALGLGDVSAGFIGNKGVLLVDAPEQADPVAARMKAQDEAKGAAHVLAEVRTLRSMLPKEQVEKLALLERVRRKLDRHRATMSAEQTQEFEAWRPPEYLRPLTIDDLPRQIREAFTETDGQRGRLVGIDVDRTTYYDWNGHDLLRLSKALQVDALGKHWVAASAVTVFAAMLETIIDDGPRVTLLALIGVAMLLVLAFGPRGSMPVLGSLAVGMAWLGGLLGLIHLRINFMNFVALPITIGVGADYAANIWARLRSDPGNLTSVIADTGSAVALCSVTTIIGFSSLLMSHNRALRSFGRLADLGEVACLVAALVALPAWVQLASRPKPPGARRP